MTSRYRNRHVRSFAILLSACCAVVAICPSALAQTAPVAAPVVNKTAHEQIDEGDKAVVARQPRVALEHYELALQTDPRNYEALWKASNALVDLGEPEADEKKRDALYAKALDYAQKSADINPESADAHFCVARSLGRKALSVGVKERVKYATDVRTHALKAIALDPKHPGALHVMGVWNAEIMRLNGLSRLFAKTFLGGAVLGSASWDEAVKYIDQAVALDPNRAVHRLDQARIYRDVGRKADARAAYQAALKSPLIDANDDLYQKQAADELRALN